MLFRSTQAKSVIYSTGIRSHELSHIQQLTGFSLGDFLFRYLGAPLLSSRLNVCHYAPLLSKITGLIQGWSRKSLSYAGKLELITTVIQGIVNFWIGIFSFASIYFGPDQRFVP